MIIRKDYHSRPHWVINPADQRAIKKWRNHPHLGRLGRFIAEHRVITFLIGTAITLLLFVTAVLTHITALQAFGVVTSGIAFIGNLIATGFGEYISDDFQRGRKERHLDKLKTAPTVSLAGLDNMMCAYRTHSHKEPALDAQLSLIMIEEQLPAVQELLEKPLNEVDYRSRRKLEQRRAKIDEKLRQAIEQDMQLCLKSIQEGNRVATQLLLDE